MIAIPGYVYLVGAGPGDPGLITLHGQSLLSQADVVLTDRLVTPEMLQFARVDAEIVDVGKEPGKRVYTQEQINQLLIDYAKQNMRVVRLKGGDPFVFGRGYEELEACRRAGVACVVVPGISSVVAAPAAAGISITHRDVARSFGVLTAQLGEDAQAGEVDYTGLARLDTVVILMGRMKLGEISHGMMAAGRSGDTPCAMIEWATTPMQRQGRATLATLERDAESAGIQSPMVLVIGDVAKTMRESDSTERGPLAGRTVVVTRPQETATALLEELRQAGARAISVPLIEVRFFDDACQVDNAASQHDLTLLDGAIRQLPNYHWLMFTSQPAVKAVWRRLGSLGKDARWLAGVRVAVVGEMTAEACRGCGIEPDLISANATGMALAGQLLERLHGQAYKVLYPKSALAGDGLAEQLVQAGHTVDEVVGYAVSSRRPSAWGMTMLQKGADAVLLHSPSAVAACRAFDVPLGHAAIVCVGPVTAEAAKGAGLAVAAVAEKATPRGVVDALRSLWG